MQREEKRNGELFIQIFFLEIAVSSYDYEYDDPDDNFFSSRKSYSAFLLYALFIR